MCVASYARWGDKWDDGGMGFGSGEGWKQWWPIWMERRMVTVCVHLLEGVVGGVEATAVALDVAWHSGPCVYLLVVTGQWLRRSWVCLLW